MFRRWVLPWLTWFLYRLWTWTWRVTLHEPDSMKEALKNNEPLIFAHWHGHELSIVPLVTRYRIATMTSTSKDGELIDFVIRRLGGSTSRGSSTRGGVGALKGLVRLVRSGHCASMAVDGPKGPLHKVKPGVFELSRLSHAKIVPVAAASSRSIVFSRSWNKAELPKPFAKVEVQFLEPWTPLERQDSARSDELAQLLEQQIAKACQLASYHLR